MKRNGIIKWGGIVIATVALATGIWSVNQETEEITIPQVVKVIDTEDGSVIVEEEEVPLASTPTVKVKTTTKKTVKKKKLKKKATKTKTTTKRTTTKKTTTTESSSKKVKTETTIKSTVQTKTKKKSKVETVTTTIKTTVKTTTTNKPKTTTTTSSTTTTAAASSSSSSSASTKVTTIVMHNLATAADSNVLQAYELMGFETEINPSKSYTGYFSAVDRKITMQDKDASTAYHELGHFVAWLAGNLDTKSEFLAIYNSEKDKVTVPNRTYLTKNSAEYFAESYREYVMDPSSLKENRPQTYEYVKNAVAKITVARAKAVKTSYEATYWK